MQLKLQDLFYGCPGNRKHIHVYIVALKQEPASLTFLYKALPTKWSNIVLGIMSV